jgi:hypothetical protein
MTKGDKLVAVKDLEKFGIKKGDEGIFIGGIRAARYGTIKEDFWSVDFNGNIVNVYPHEVKKIYG